jgi:hypothetical protein
VNASDWDHLVWAIAAVYALWLLRKVLDAIREQTAAINRKAEFDTTHIELHLASIEDSVSDISREVSEIKDGLHPYVPDSPP